MTLIRRMIVSLVVAALLLTVGILLTFWSVQQIKNLLFVVSVLSSLLVLLAAIAIAWLICWQAWHQLQNQFHLKTQHLLETQEAMNPQLQQTNMGMQATEEQLAVTLHSIDDAVIATDANACVRDMQIFNVADSPFFPYSYLATMENGTSKQAEDAHVKVGALQSAIFNSANFSSIATDAKGVIQIFNVGAERMLGYFAQEVVNKITPADISDPQEVVARAKSLSTELDTPITPGFEALVFKASRGIEDIYELTYIRKDGSRFPAVVSVTALRNDQETIIGYLLIGTDNTARKKAEEALLKAGALQKAIFDSANFSSIATDAKGVIQIFNVGAERMLGYSAAEVMNQRTPADISDPQEIIARAKTLSTELDTPITPGFEALVFKASRGIEDIYELTYIRKDGSRFPAVVSVTALRDDQETIIGYLLIGTDNTARKQAEGTLRKSTDLLKSVLENVPARIFWKDLDSRYLGCNSRFAADAGCSSPLDLTGKSDLDIAWKDQAKQYRADDLEVMKSGLAKLNFEEQQTTPEGKLIWLRTSKVPMRDENDQIFGVLGSYEEITGLKLAEEELLKAGALQKAIFDSANFSSIATDAKGVIQIFNVGAERMLGYSAAEVMNQRTPADISDPQEIIAQSPPDLRPWCSRPRAGLKTFMN
jgi:PAS domain S-box-containing protein